MKRREGKHQGIFPLFPFLSGEMMRNRSAKLRFKKIVTYFRGLAEKLINDSDSAMNNIAITIFVVFDT